MKMRVLTSARWKLVHCLNEPVGELYDRVKDPGEMRNLWAEPQHNALRAQLTAQLLDEVICIQEMRNGRRQLPAPAVPHWSANSP